MKPIYFLAIIPVIAILGGPFWANRVEPYILGMPLFFFWNFSWLIFTAVIVFIIYKLDPLNKGREE